MSDITKEVADPVGVLTVTFGTSTTFTPRFKSLKAFGRDGGAPIDMTGLTNTAYRTKAARTLQDITNLTGSAFWDASETPPINVEQAITFGVAGVGAWTIQGYLAIAEPQDSDDEQDTGTQQNIEIVVTNRNPSTLAETGPSFAAAT